MFHKFAVGFAFIIVIQGIWFPWFGIVDVTSCNNLVVYGTSTYCHDMVNGGMKYFIASLITVS